ncbi:chromosome segregation ATPase [Granulicella aggregans]|uniref:Chromosome segregation ATPase n=1 Tax=Granulicella aggregans TaxID=474949 RepID=A0A7W7ZK00_9BACT|nr:hypothetical protein [Granulicella aggregans]MBB5061335.1 chromosome segregation ATPase [Granulicella aggregans]
MRMAPLLLTIGLSVLPVFSQTNHTDSQVQQQILEELRAIHHELRANTTLQLLLVELQTTQSSLNQATQRRDNLKAQIAGLQGDRSAQQAEVVRFEERMAKVTTPDQESIDKLEGLKNGLQAISAHEAAMSELLEDAENRLRTAQTERESIQSQLSDLVRKLSAFN